MSDALVQVAEVKAYKTQSGNVRFVLRDRDGNEYTTFRDEIARKAVAAEGRRAHITFHEQKRGNFTNVYLDSVEVVDDSERAADGGEEIQEAAWRTAMEAAPWLVGEAETPVPPDELFERLQPFKERVAEDIRTTDGGGTTGTCT
jgi:hypothetical protein